MKKSAAILAKVIIILVAVGISVGTSYAKQPPAPIAEPEDLVIVAVGDIACSPKHPNYNGGLGSNNRCQHEHVVAAINREPRIDAAILLGDIQYDFGEYDYYMKSFSPAWSKIKAESILAVMGNHDYGFGSSSSNFEHAMPETFGLRFVNFKGKTYGKWEKNDWTFFGLDSDCEFVGGCTANDPQALWLKEQLSYTTGECSLSFWHYPIFSSGKYPVKNMRPAWAMLEQAGSDIVLNGHDHLYERFSRQSLTVPEGKGMRQFIAGTGGYSLHNFLVPFQPGHEVGLREFGYLKLTLKKGSYAWQFINVDSEIKDSGQEACHAPPPKDQINESLGEDTSHEPTYMPQQEELEDEE